MLASREKSRRAVFPTELLSDSNADTKFCNLMLLQGTKWSRWGSNDSVATFSVFHIPMNAVPLCKTTYVGEKLNCAKDPRDVSIHVKSTITLK